MTVPPTTVPPLTLPPALERLRERQRRRRPPRASSTPSLAANVGHMLAYGDDEITRECSARFRDLFGADVTTRLDVQRHRRERPGPGDAARVAARPAPRRGVHRLGAHRRRRDRRPERALATKLIDLPSADGKLVPEQLAELAGIQGVQHHVQPGVVSITQATELGTLYTRRRDRRAVRSGARTRECWSTSTAPASPTPPPRSAEPVRRCVRSRSTRASTR